MTTWRARDAERFFLEIGPEGRETYRVFYRRTDFWFPGLVISLFYVSFLALAFPPSSPFSWIATFLTISVVSLISVIFWELWVARKQQRPILDLKLFQNRTFALSVAMMFVLGATLYGVNTHKR